MAYSSTTKSGNRYDAKDDIIVVMDEHECQLLQQRFEQSGPYPAGLTLVVKGASSNPRGSPLQNWLVLSLLLVLGVISLLNAWNCPGFAEVLTHKAEKIKDVTTADKEHEKTATPLSSQGLPPNLSRVRRQTRGTTSFAHLKGPTHTSRFQARYDNAHNRYYLLWEMPSRPSEITGSVRTLLAPNLPVNKVQGLRVRSPGYYMVYSQVAIHGRRNNSRTVHYDCSHSTVKISRGTQTELLKSLITQNNGGHPVRHQHSTGRVAPSDTALQMGVFLLNNGDQVRVGYPAHCHHVRYTLGADSYFGLIKLGSVRN